MTMENHPAEPFTEVLRELAAIKQGLAMQALPAIPLEAFINMLRDVYGFHLPERTAQDMIGDGRIPLMPKLRTRDQRWVNLVRWREMAEKPGNYFQFVHENVRQRAAKPASKPANKPAASRKTTVTTAGSARHV